MHTTAHGRALCLKPTNVALGRCMINRVGSLLTLCCMLASCATAPSMSPRQSSQPNLEVRRDVGFVTLASKDSSFDFSFRYPEGAVVTKIVGHGGSGYQIAGNSYILRMTAGQESGSVSCSNEQNCEMFTLTYPSAVPEYALRSLDPPRIGSDIAHPTQSEERFPIQILSLSPITGDRRIFVETFCKVRSECIRLIQNLELTAGSDN